MNKKNEKILILGAGNFGTCLAQHLASLGHHPTLVTRSESAAKSINQDHINSKYLSSFKLNTNIKASSKLTPELLEPFGTIVIAVPTQTMRAVITPIKEKLRSKVIVCVSKGIEAKTLSLPSAILSSLLGKEIEEQTAYLSGPSFAIEVMEKQPTAVTVAGKNKKLASFVQNLFHAPHFRVYLSEDPIGAEIAGALKNVIAIAAGACKGLDFKENSSAALVTRGLAELTRIGVSLGANNLTFKGLAGIGDLMLTCNSDKSRNFRVGYLIAKGKSLEEAQKSLGSVAEGVVTTKAAFLLAQKKQIRASIIKAVYQVLYESWNLEKALEELLTGSAKNELE